MPRSDLIHGLAVLDQGSRSVQVKVDGVWQGTWTHIDGISITRGNALDAIASDGWRPWSETDDWEMSVWENGHVLRVVKDA